VPDVDDAVRRRGRKRGRRDAEQLAGEPRRIQQRVSATPPVAINTSSIVSISAASGSSTNSGFTPAQLSALALTTSALSSTRTATTVNSVKNVTSPRASSLVDCATPVRPHVENIGPRATDVEQALSRVATGSSHREGLVLLANCAVSRPTDVTQVKVEPEVVLADYELTAMNSPEASFYERKRMAAAETTSTEAPPSLSDLHIPPLVTGSRSRSPGKDVGPLTLASGRIECRECGRYFASVAAYNKHNTQVHR